MRKSKLSKLAFLFCLIINVFYGTAHTAVTGFNADSLIALMTVEEKIDFIAGYKNFNIKGLKRLNIPSVKMADGPMGLKGHGKATAFPASICMAASWNPDLIKKMASAIATEAKSKGIGVLLAPGINMYRVPHCGRNFEYYGEDPFLTSQMAVSFIQGVQSQKVMATVKHFVANNHDYDRHRVSSNIDERTLHEIYFPAFKAAVQQAEVGAVMTSYNLLNGIHTSESSYLIKEILKEKWGFSGVVLSDWISVYSINAFYAGLDIEMPRAQFMNPENILPLIANDESGENILNDKIKRILESCNRLGLYDKDVPIDSVDWKNHKQIAKQVAREGFVLLKNKDNILPLNKKDNQRILVLGPNALYTPYSGGGAAMIEAYEMTSFFDGIKNNAPHGIQIDYLPVEGMYRQTSAINYKRLCKELNVVKDYHAVVLCIGFDSESEGEAFDRPFALPKKQELLLNEICKIQSNIIVVINSGGGVYMPWLEKIKALLYAWYPGQEGGNALGEIIFGKINPSGKLPISIEKQWKDAAAFNFYDTTHAVPGTKPFYTLYGKKHPIEQMDYEEGIFTGYRYFDYNETEPLFNFGFGLSYTSFEFSGLSMDKLIMTNGDSLRIELTVKNSGDADGAEIVQVYIRDIESSLPRPVKELKAFRKIYLKAGEKARIEFTINKNMLSFYHPDEQDWITENGNFEILIGNSLNNIKLKQIISFKELNRK